ncbi:GDP-L-fucose synthase [Synechococcus sp. PROS-7-1]|uniref:GDP-L-fucose synthase family protein n=1 Tax=Synechococcus sp. PROS-7-1 TaxID=1442556 RepID=UPI00164783F6|nr:GDP-L-fucose synthase [Synechococcus sp. PROS-7-1]
MALLRPSDRIFIAGARGMAGSAISRALTRAGYHEQLTPSRQELNLLDDAAVSAWMQTQQPDVVVLAAATVGGIEANRSRPADFLLQNLRIETQVIEAAWRAGVRRLLFLGSSCIYPKFAAQPIREEALLTGALEPTNAWYAIAKIAGIKLGEALRRQHGFDAISLMPTNLYGPGDNYHPTGSHVLPALIRRFHEAKQAGAAAVTCWGSGTPLREFLHADDLGEACVFALEHWSTLGSNAPCDDQGEPLAFLNVGTGIDLSIRELAEQVAATVGFQGAIHWDTSKPDGTPKKQLNVSRLSQLGWRARIALSEGLPLAYEDFCAHLNDGSLRG